MSGAGLDGVPGVRVNLVRKSLAGGPSSRGLTSGYTPRQQAAVLSGDRVSGRLKLLNKVLQVRTLSRQRLEAFDGSTRSTGSPEDMQPPDARPVRMESQNQFMPSRSRPKERAGDIRQRTRTVEGVQSTGSCTHACLP